MPRSLSLEEAVITTHEEYIVDSDGKRKAVVLPWEEWQEVMEALEELDDIRAYDEVPKFFGHCRGPHHPRRTRMCGHRRWHAV